MPRPCPVPPQQRHRNVLAVVERELVLNVPRYRCASGRSSCKREEANGKSNRIVVIARSTATKQSIFSPDGADGWLRGACHRARIRATRWLATTALNS